MATYTKETALYDTGAIAADIANAGTTATSYITRVDATNGIRVHDLNESTDFVQVNSSAISMYRGGTAAANEKVRIEDDEIRVGATTTGHAVLDEDGMDVYIGDTSVAHYGEMARVGLENSSHMEVYGDSIVGVSSSGNKFFEVNENGGSTPAVSWYTLYEQRLKTGMSGWGSKTFDLTTVPLWSSVANGETFYASVYYTRSSGVPIYSKTVEFTKGTTNTSDSLIKYTAPNALNFAASGTHTDCNTRVMKVGISTTINGSLYRFGKDVAETGGANSFLIGTGTAASSSNQLAIGAYNYDYANAPLMVGNGSSNSNRSNALTVTNGGDLRIRNNLYIGCNADGSGGIKLNDFDVSNLLVMQPIGSAVPSQKVARRFGNFIYVSYKIGGISLSASSTTAILSLFEEVRPANEAIVPANITDSNYATVGTGLIRFETGGWVYLVAPKSLSQTSGLYVMFTALYLI